MKASKNKPKPKKDYDKIYRLFEISIVGSGLPTATREFHFNPEKRWKRCRRIDFCWPAYKLALEIEGGAWTKKGHTNGVNFIADMEKYNELAFSGFFLLRVTPEQVEKGEALELLERWFKSDGRWTKEAVN